MFAGKLGHLHFLSMQREKAGDSGRSPDHVGRDPQASQQQYQREKFPKIPKGCPEIQDSNRFTVPKSQHDPAVAALVTCFSSKRGVLQVHWTRGSETHTLFIWQVVEQKGKQVGGTLTSKAVTWLNAQGWLCAWLQHAYGVKSFRAPTQRDGLVNTKSFLGRGQWFRCLDKSNLSCP